MTQKEIDEIDEYLAYTMAKSYTREQLEQKLKDSQYNSIFKDAIQIQIKKGWK